jgi:hypothetical protein
MPRLRRHQIRHRARNHRRILTVLIHRRQQVLQIGQDLGRCPGGRQSVDFDGQARNFDEAREAATEADDACFGGCWGVLVGGYVTWDV